MNSCPAILQPCCVSLNYYIFPLSLYFFLWNILPFILLHKCGGNTLHFLFHHLSQITHSPIASLPFIKLLHRFFLIHRDTFNPLLIFQYQPHNLTFPVLSTKNHSPYSRAAQISKPHWFLTKSNTYLLYLFYTSHLFQHFYIIPNFSFTHHFINTYPRIYFQMGFTPHDCLQLPVFCIFVFCWLWVILVPSVYQKTL